MKKAPAGAGGAAKKQRPVVNVQYARLVRHLQPEA